MFLKSFERLFHITDPKYLIELAMQKTVIIPSPAKPDWEWDLLPFTALNKYFKQFSDKLCFKLYIKYIIFISYTFQARAVEYLYDRICLRNSCLNTASLNKTTSPCCFKVACMAQMKTVFMDWFVYNFIILILTSFWKTRYFVWKIEIFDEH